MRAAHIAVDAQDIGTHTVADTQILFRDHLVAWQTCFDLARFDDGVAAFHALDGAGDERIAAFQEVDQDLFAFGVTYALQDDLFGILGETAAEFDGFDRFFDMVIDFDIGDLFFCLEMQDLLIRQLQARFIGHHVPAAERFEFARVAVDRNADVYFTLIPFLRGLRQREFEGAEDDIFIDVFFARQRVNQ